MALVYPEITFAYVISILGTVYGFALIMFFRELRKRPETVMARFKLNKEKTIKDFRRMLAGNIMLALSMALMLSGIARQNNLVLNISYICQIASSAIIVYTITTWVRDYAF
jgi:hypothetical protein